TGGHMYYPKRLFALLSLCLSLALSGCLGTTSTSQTQLATSAKADTTDSVTPGESTEHSYGPRSRTEIEEPRAAVSRSVPKAKPSRDIARNEVPKKEASAAEAAVPAPAPAASPTAPAASPTAPAASPTLTLPAPVAPTVDAPGAPPEPTPVKSEPVASVA